MITLTRRSLPLAFLLVVTGVCLPAVAAAQCPPPPSTSLLVEGEVGLFFDPLGTETCADIMVGVTTPLYVVARVPEGGIADFVVPEIIIYALPSGLIVVTEATLPPGSPYDAVILVDACTTAHRPDQMTCPVAQGDILAISVIQVMALAPVGGMACFQTACPTIAGVVAAPPGYHRCDTGAAGEFAGWDVMCIGFGEAPVPVASSTWGAVKSLYQD